MLPLEATMAALVHMATHAVYTPAPSAPKAALFRGEKGHGSVREEAVSLARSAWCARL